MAGIREVIHVTQELHEVAAQGGHYISGVAPRQPPHHLDGQTSHYPCLIVQCHKQRPQAATHQQDRYEIFLAGFWRVSRFTSVSRVSKVSRVSRVRRVSRVSSA